MHEGTDLAGERWRKSRYLNERMGRMRRMRMRIRRRRVRKKGWYKKDSFALLERVEDS